MQYPRTPARPRIHPVRCALALSLAARAAGAQFTNEPTAGPRATTAFAALSVNALVGGATAAVRARLEHRDVPRALARGLMGGAVHFAGKYVAARPGSLSGPLGVAIGSTGTAMVSNAGRGAAPFDELFLPVGPLRVRLARADSAAPRRVRLTLNAAEAVVLGQTFARKGLRVDWTRSASAGAFVFVAPRRGIISDGRSLDGTTTGSVVVLSGLVGRLAPIARHEASHSQHQWFAQEAWGRPVEQWLRRRVPVLRRLPAWIEPGVAVGLMDAIDDELHDDYGYGPLARLRESEAVLLERE